MCVICRVTERIIINEFKNKVEIIIDGGKSKDIPSTIIRVENNKINIIRNGTLKIKELL